MFEEFAYDSEAHEKRPKTGPRVGFESLPQTHLMLAILGLVSMAQGFFIAQHLVVNSVNLSVVMFHVLLLRCHICLSGLD